ncbi:MULTISPECIES: hypothetical protein [unclassified Mesorhizobium]|uniref:hypothetical protein n=1 Tax=unclassified Mesorhizobium TaxID=325217 RepID=UPI001AC00ADE|nr:MULTISPECIES: hypothetical protein [unclassified Mesorhizobium]
MLDRGSHNQAIYPDDLSALKRVFDELCREGDISPILRLSLWRFFKPASPTKRC